MIRIAHPAATPYIPERAANIAIPNRHKRTALAKSRFGKTKPQIPAAETMINAAGDYVISFVVSRFVDGKDWLDRHLSEKN